MIFVPGTEPFKAVQNGFSDDLKVLGIPRVNLNAVSTFINAPENADSVTAAAGVTRKLPYEMIIVALE